MHVLQTVTRPKKVTHLVTICDEEIHCTSAAHVCIVLNERGFNVTPAIVYRCCSKDPRRVHRKACLPDGVVVRRVPKDDESSEDTAPQPQNE